MLDQHPAIAEKISLAHRLAEGGIVLYTKEDITAQEVIQEWPEKLFGEKAVVHQIKSTKPVSSVAYIRNVPVSCTLASVVVALPNFKTISLRRLRYYDTGKPMPIVKASFTDKAE